MLSLDLGRTFDDAARHRIFRAIVTASIVGIMKMKIPIEKVGRLLNPYRILGG